MGFKHFRFFFSYFLVLIVGRCTCTSILPLQDYWICRKALRKMNLVKDIKSLSTGRTLDLCDKCTLINWALFIILYLHLVSLVIMREKKSNIKQFVFYNKSLSLCCYNGSIRNRIHFDLNFFGAFCIFFKSN